MAGCYIAAAELAARRRRCSDGGDGSDAWMPSDSKRDGGTIGNGCCDMSANDVVADVGGGDRCGDGGARTAVA